MRFLILILVMGYFHPLFAQDKVVLQKQLLQILKDYPNKFKNLELVSDTDRLRFNITGTYKETLIVKGKKIYISAIPSLSKSDAETRVVFDKWVNALSEVSFNGTKMIGSPTCHADCGDFVMHSKIWSFDNSQGNIDRSYFSFKILLEMLDIEGVFSVSLQIGEVD